MPTRLKRSDRKGGKRFDRLSYADFRRMARDASLSKYEKIGFPDRYRANYEKAIFRDILVKLPKLLAKRQVVLDIGPGCSDLPRMLIDLCRRQEHRLVLVDSAEMLDLLPEAPFITKVSGKYPGNVKAIVRASRQYDVMLCYSVLHHVFVDGNIWSFLDRSLALLGAGGQMLIGDVPNVSKRRRFFSSDAGIAFHRSFMGTADDPTVQFNVATPGEIDDAAVLGLLLRARNAGVDAYLVPQAPDLPMANRREDLLLRKP